MRNLLETPVLAEVLVAVQPGGDWRIVYHKLEPDTTLDQRAMIGFALVRAGARLARDAGVSLRVQDTRTGGELRLTDLL